MTYILRLIVSLFCLEGTSKLTRRARPPLSPVKSRGRPDFADSGSRTKVMILEDRTSGSPFLLLAFKPRSFCFSRAVELWKKCPGSLETLMTFEDQRRPEIGRTSPGHRSNARQHPQSITLYVTLLANSSDDAQSI